MSLILEALKKIESDRTRNVKNTDIAAAILQYDGGARRKRVMLISSIAGAAALLLIAAGAGIAFLLVSRQQPVVTAMPAVQVAPVQEPVRTIAVPPVAAAKASSPERSQEPAAVPSESKAEPIVAARSGSEPAKDNAAPVASRDSRSAEYDSERAVRGVTRNKTAHQAKASSPTPDVSEEQGAEGAQSADAAVAPKPSRKAPARIVPRQEVEPIKLTGIIWSDDHAKSRALVNGASVREGETIDGAYVERIEQNRILCKRNGKTFSVPVRSEGE